MIKEFVKYWIIARKLAKNARKIQKDITLCMLIDLRSNEVIAIKTKNASRYCRKYEKKASVL
jgi:hypothetical protein